MLLPINSKTLRWGIGCFETIKIYKNNQIAFLQKHLKRLQIGAEICGLRLPPLNEISEEIINFVQHNKSLQSDTNHNKILRLILTEETGLQYFIESYVETKPMVKLRISDKFFKQSNNILNTFKSFNYLQNYLASQEAFKMGFDDALLLNEKGEISETTKANVFFMDNHENWLTTPLDSGCLPGILREELISILNVEEKSIKPEDLKCIKSVLCTNSLIEIKSISHINDREFFADKTILNSLEKILREKSLI